MKVDRGSETWAAVVAWANRERARAMEALMDRRTSHDDTQFSRGLLEALRRLELMDSLDAPIAVEKSVDY